MRSECGYVLFDRSWCRLLRGKLAMQGVDALARGWILGDGCPQLIDGQFRPIFRHLISPQ
jgi:hypothetical protein